MEHKPYALLSVSSQGQRSRSGVLIISRVHHIYQLHQFLLTVFFQFLRERTEKHTDQLTRRNAAKNNTCFIIIIINKVLIKVTLNKVIAGALYIVICGWNAVTYFWQHNVSGGNTWVRDYSIRDSIKYSSIAIYSIVAALPVNDITLK